MRILFVVWAWPSHFFPMVPTAWASWAAGHEVLVATQPALQKTLRDSGLPAACVGADLDTAGMFRNRMAKAKDAEGRLTKLSAPGKDAEGRLTKLTAPGAPRAGGPADPRLLVLEVYGALARAMADDTVRLAKGWSADVVVWDPITFAGAIAARAAGALSVRHTWGLDSARSMRLYDDWPSDLRALLAEHDVPVERVREDLCLDICPPLLQLPPEARTTSARYVPYNGPDAGASRIMAASRRPRVCVTWGTTVEQLAGKAQFPAGEALRALAAHDVDVVVAASDEQVSRLGALPENVTATGWMPLRTVLESCTAIVHEGGAGTLMTASLLGVPQLVIPTLHEQILAGERLAATGAGRHLAAGAATAAAIEQALAPLLGANGHRQAALALRQHILDQPTLGDTVSRWDGLAG
ncbi:nucleotide disphospho-sugar-binding domain-containing protein [Nonomuraea sp. NPDC049750]|uniref:nucleotide disphospho-sugar-binding domain-containing protein n=1 Tax=Nonomuraea sp. NPDC049750 TaxID=3154738 RepID=UPI0033DD80FC